MSDNSETPAIRARRAARQPLPKRFYRSVSVEAGEGGFAVQLDRRAVRTPGKAALALPSEALAEAVAQEWRAQKEHVEPGTMPLTRLVNTIIDRIALARDDVVEEIASYAGTDLVCYRAEAPQELALRQGEAWDPVLAWAEAEFGIRMRLAAGVMHVAQDDEVLKKFRQEIENENDFVLGALAAMTGLTGSALLALAVLRGRLTAEEAWAAAHVDEDWQIAQWGADEEAAARRRLREAEMRAAALVVAELAGRQAR